MKRIIGVRFKRLGKIYFFDPKWLEVKKGESVIVETSQGEEIAEVVVPNRMIEEEMYLKVVHRKNYHNEIIDIGDILTVLVIYDEDDKEEYTIKLTGKYLPNTDSLINEISRNSPIGRCIYLKNIYDDIYYYVNDKRIDIKVIIKDNMFTI